MIRIYTKPKGQIPDYEEPVILHAEAPTVRDFCNRLHKSIVNQFQYAWVWGSSVKHQPQRVGLDHVLMDEDVVQIVNWLRLFENKQMIARRGGVRRNR